MTVSPADSRSADPKRIAQPGCKGRTKAHRRAKAAPTLRTGRARAARRVVAVTRLVQSVP
jgi:hypothetical protein